MKKKLKYLLFLGFIAFNIIAYIQAYHFTHYSKDDIVKSDEKQGFLENLKMIFGGVNNPRPKSELKPSFEYENINIEDKLKAWYIPVTEAKGTVILFHGFAASKDSMLERAYILNNLGFNTCLLDFMGSGESEGNITTIGFKEAENVKSIYEHIRTQKNEQNIILLGTSMGSAAILKALNDYPELKPQGIIIECPYASMIETISIRCQLLGIPSFPTAQALTFWGGVQHNFNAFDMNPSEYARKVQTPTLLVYGINDDKVALSETTKIFDNLSSDKDSLIYNHSGHSDYLVNEKEKWTHDISSFLQKVN